MAARPRDAPGAGALDGLTPAAPGTPRAGTGVGGWPSHPSRRSAITAPATPSALATLDRQVDTLLALGYPALAGLTDAAFTARLEHLRPLAASLPAPAEPAGPGLAPLVLVVTRVLVDPLDTVPLLRLSPRGTRPGVVDRNHGDEGLAPYRPIEHVALPHPEAYLLLDVDRGAEFRGVRPEDALPVVLARGRTPLTVEEGIAVGTHAPALLEKNHCFMLSGSRRGDRRVPALWISQRAPKLGWCWDGNPHDWLGVASAGGRRA